MARVAREEPVGSTVLKMRGSTERTAALVAAVAGAAMPSVAAFVTPAAHSSFKGLCCPAILRESLASSSAT